MTLSREELASDPRRGVRFEAVLMAGFGLMLAYQPDLADPRVTYVLHEIGEETRHSRLFIRVVSHNSSRSASTPSRNAGTHASIDLATTVALGWKVLFCVMVLTGEESPDLLQRRSSEHPDTDPFVREVNRYHRAEEARHLSFARTLLPELWAGVLHGPNGGWCDMSPRYAMEGIFDSLVHPGVYRTVGLPGWRTWNRVRVSAERRGLRAEAFRPVAAALVASGAFGRKGRIPRAWRRACRIEATTDLSTATVDP